MQLRKILLKTGLPLALAILSVPRSAPQQAPPAAGARILIMPRRVVSGERATLAVLDINGRLTPDVTVRFSNGERLKTDTTGRARFVASLNPGILFGSIEGRPGRVPMVVLSRAEAGSSAIEVTSAPRIASTADRFEISGNGFCGDADANQVTIGSEQALVLASSPAMLVVLPPNEIAPGQVPVHVSCAKREAAGFSVMLVELELEADTAPLGPGDVRQLTVRVRGTTGKVILEARNLAPEFAELRGGNPLRQTSSGGQENTARFEVVGRKKGNFLVSIRLVPSAGKPRP